MLSPFPPPGLSRACDICQEHFSPPTCLLWTASDPLFRPRLSSHGSTPWATLWSTHYSCQIIICLIGYKFHEIGDYLSWVSPKADPETRICSAGIAREHWEVTRCVEQTRRQPMEAVFLRQSLQRTTGVQPCGGTWEMCGKASLHYPPFLLRVEVAGYKYPTPSSHWLRAAHRGGWEVNSLLLVTGKNISSLPEIAGRQLEVRLPCLTMI